MSKKTRRRGIPRVNPVHVVNTEIQSLVASIKGSTPAFGPALHDLDGVSLNDSVVVHRLTAKHFEPIEGTESAMHLTAVSKMIAHDEGYHPFDIFEIAPANRRILYGAKATLSEWFRGFKPTYRFRPPSGESALSNFGLTDVLYKLEDTKHWEVSAEALPFATAIAYRNRWLKKVVKAHFAIEEPTGISAKMQKQLWYHSWRSSNRKVSAGFYVFGKMFASLCKLNTVTRITSIFKDARARRVISMVPLWNMVCQLSLMLDMRDWVQKKLGFDIYSRADLHKTLIAHRAFATVDLRNASNSVWKDVVDFLYDAPLRKWFDRLVDRHYMYELERGSDEWEYGYFNMFAPMGCGLTFDVMTMMLLAIGRQLDSGATVFGDDIMIRSTHAKAMIDCLQSIGLETNIEKTFVTGNLSESCGGFYNHASQEYIVCYDFVWCENTVEAFATVNKLRAIIDAAQVSISLRSKLFNSYQRILEQLQRFAVAGSTENIPSGFIAVWDWWPLPERRATRVQVMLQKWLHREVVAVPVRELHKKEQKPRDGVSTLAAWFFRGGSYNPNTSEEFQVVEMCDTFSLTPLNRYQLVSVLHQN